MIAAVVAGAVAGAGAAAWARRRRMRPEVSVRAAAGRPPWSALWVFAAAAAGGVAGWAAGTRLGDPVLAPLGAALAWGAWELGGRIAEERRLFDRTWACIPLLSRVQQEAQAGGHPLTAVAWAVRLSPPPLWLARRIAALTDAVASGQPLARAAADWAEGEPLPILRLFGRLLSTHAAWGTDLGAALRRLVQEADRSVAFGREQRMEHRLYEAMTAVFLVLDAALEALALARWPRAVPGPAVTTWGRALVIGSALVTALAVAVPLSLAATAPPRLYGGRKGGEGGGS